MSALRERTLARARAGSVVLALAGLLVAAPSQAQVARSFTSRFTYNGPGSITLTGNTVMVPTNQGGSDNNDNKTMVYTDVDADASTFSSSTATLNLPTGATVQWAGLYWGGSSANAARNTMKLAAPGGSYVTYTATQLDAIGNVYQGFRDVTALVAASGSGIYKAANVYSTPNTGDVWAGWAIVVVYRLDTMTMRNLVVADGFMFVKPGSPLNFMINGFLTPPTGTVQTSVGFVAYDGDNGFQGEDFILNGTTLSDALNPPNNVFNSSLTLLGQAQTGKNPDLVNNWGYDADILSANGVLANGSSSATIILQSASDRYYPGVLTFNTEIFVPKFDATSFTKTVTDVNGGVVAPGDLLEYTITATNNGTDAATQTTVRDTLPSNVTFVAGSMSVATGPNAGVKTDASADDQMDWQAPIRTVVARLGTGANGVGGGTLAIGASTSVRFRVRVNAPAPTGTLVSNQAAISCVGQTMGVAVNERSDGDAATAGVQPTVVTTTSAPMSGTVFEDVNYGGGAGRTRAASSGAAVRSARVELYDGTGAFTTSTTTDSLGAFTFDGWQPGAWQVRVVNSSVLSTRPGALATLLPVQTFRTDASSGAAVAVTDRVGGEVPSRADAAANVTNAALATLTTGSTAVQSLTPVTLGASAVGGLDFGFNFDTIVNVNDTGQGSLRQFVNNANTLGNTGLAPSGQTAGVEVTIFMVSDGAAHAGLRAGLANLLTGGVARITCATALPAVGDAATRIDGATQTANVGNTNAAVLGAGGTVGVDALALATVAGPEVEIVDGAAIGVGLDLEGANQAVNAVAIRGFGNAPASNTDANVLVGAVANGARITACVLGTTATSFADPGAAARSGGDQIRVIGGDNGVVSGCLVGYAAGSGVSLNVASNGWQVTGCEIRGNTIGNGARDGITVSSSSGETFSGNLVADQDGCGIDFNAGSGTVTLVDNTVTRCGRLGTAATDQAGVRAGGANNVIDRNVLASNYGAGVMVAAAATNNVITKNTMSGNGTISKSTGGAPSGEIGIDLQSATDDPSAGTAPFVTKNDLNDADAGANGLLNFPVIDSAAVIAGTLTISGWARPGSTIEVFVSDGDASGFGEGATYATTLVEGAAGDLDATSSAYSGLVNGLDQGSDNTRRFRFVLAAPAGVSPGVKLTATATIAGTGTSEFSGVVLVSGGVSVSGFVYADADHDAMHDAAEGGVGSSLWVKLVASGGTSAAQVAAADPTTGAFTLASVGAGTWTLVLDTNSSPADVTAGIPSGWLGSEAPAGVRTATVAGVALSDQNFGLWHGARADGVVFRDDGAGAGVANDGVPQAGESGIANARVRLLAAACAGGQCDSTLTDGAGRWSLWVPFAATGTVTRIGETNPAGWLSTGGTPGTSGGSYARATDLVTWMPVAGVVATGLGFGDVPPNTFVAPGAKAAPPGGAAAYTHRFTAGSAGSVAFAVAEAPSPAIPGWSFVLVRDLDCNGVADPGEPVVSGALAVSAGQQVCLVARHVVPAGAPAGASELATVSASFVYTGASPALSDTARLGDLTTVTSQGLLITKSVSAANARPGDALTYTIQYTNLGSQPLSGIVIHDTTPAWTTFTSAGCGSLGGGLTGCSVSSQPAAGGTGAVAWSLAGTLSPGGSGSVTFVVKVQ